MKKEAVTSVLIGMCAFNVFSQDIKWEPLGEPGGGGAIVALAVSPHDSRHLISSGDMLGAGVSFDGGDSWKPCFGFPAYEMCSITFDPSRMNDVWMGTCMGPFKSIDGGRHWVSKRIGMPPVKNGGYSVIVEKVLFDPARKDRLLAFGGSSRRWNSADSFGWIWESLDNGETWKHIGTLTTDGFTSVAKKGVNIIRASYEPGSKNKIHILADEIGWWTSEDGGRTWRRNQPTGIRGEITGVTFHPLNPKTVWVATTCFKAVESDKMLTPGGVFKSVDGGATFVESDQGIHKVATGDKNQTSWFYEVAVSAAAPDELYVNDQAWNSNVIYKSADGGETWFPVASRRGVGADQSDASRRAFQVQTACFAGVAMKLVADQSKAGTIYGFNTEFILRTKDGGKTWDDATAFRPDPAKPDNWRGRGWNGWCSMDFEFNPYRQGQSVALAMDAARGWISDDGLKSWRYTMGQTHPWLGGQSVGFSQDGWIYITTGHFGSGNGIQRSADGGKTWTTLEGEKRGLPPAGWGNGKEFAGVYVHPANGRVAWVALKGSLLNTTDGGETWSPVAGVSGANQIAGDPTKAGRFYVKTGEGVLVTEDGKTFVNIGLPGVNPRSRINCDAQGRVLVCQWRQGRGGLWRYTPKTAQWQRLLDDPEAYECKADPTDPTRLLLVTSIDPYCETASGNGVWISHDDGKSWSRANNDLPMLRLNACAFNPFDPEEIVAGTYGMGFFKARWPKTFKPVGTRTYVQGPEDSRAAAVPVKVPEGPATLERVLIRNGGMRQGLKMVAQWKGGYRDTDIFKTEPASLRVDQGDSVQRIDGFAGKKIRLVGWMRTSGKARAQVAVQSFAEGYKQNQWQQLIYLQDETGWTKFDKEITIPSWTQWSDLKLVVEGAGSAWLDEIHDAAGDVDEGKPVTETGEMVNSAPPKGRPWEPAWCIYDWRPAWFGMHDGFVARTKKGGIDVVAYGDSIMMGWEGGADKLVKSINPDLAAVNYGIGGDSTRQLLWRISHGEVDGIKPRLVILGIGTNNLYGDQNAGNDEEIAKGIEAVVKLLREKLPGTKILLLSILPRQNDYFCNRLYAINSRISKLSTPGKVIYHDRTALFQEAPGKIKTELFNGDQLHLKKASYEVWDADLKPVVAELLKD